MEPNDLSKILDENSGTDSTALKRSQQMEKQLADLGIELGGYRLSPALGSTRFDEGVDIKQPGRVSRNSGSSPEPQ